MQLLAQCSPHTVTPLCVRPLCVACEERCAVGERRQQQRVGGVQEDDDVEPDEDPGGGCDLVTLIDQLQARGVVLYSAV